MRRSLGALVLILIPATVAIMYVPF
jgi:hypothetical protein